MKIKYISIIISIISLLIISCKDNNTQPEPADNKDYLPLTIGNYWIYKTYELNQYQDTISATVQLDSLVCISSSEIDGKMAFFLARFRNGIPLDTLVFSNSKDSIHKVFNKYNFSIPGLNNIWFKIYDSKNLDWNLLGIRIINYPFYFIDNEILTTIDHAVNDYYRGSDTFIINNLKVLQQHFEIKHDSRLFFPYKFTYTITIDSLVYDTISPDNIKVDTIKINRLTYDSVQVFRHTLEFERYFFANEVGITMLQKDTYYEQFWTVPYTSRYPGGRKFFNGSRSFLIRYFINK